MTYYQVFFKYFNDQGIVRASSLVVSAKDTVEARKKALEQVSKTHDNVVLTNCKLWE